MTGHPSAALREALRDTVTDPAWLAAALREVASSPAAVAGLFPAVGRRCGRGPLKDDADPEFAGWTVDEAARVLLLTALPLSGPALTEQVRALYRHGDPAEKRAVLRALPYLGIGDAGVEQLHDAIRTNDPRLVAAALGRYARHLDDETWRQAVLKCVFMEIPLKVVAGLATRADQELARMLAGLGEERHAAGRALPADAAALLAGLAGPALPAGLAGPALPAGLTDGEADDRNKAR